MLDGAELRWKRIGFGAAALAVALAVVLVGGLALRGWSASRNLLAASAVGNVPAAEQALEAGADPDVRGPSGDTPLILAVRDTHAMPVSRGQMVRLLLARGANASLANEIGDAPLHLAARQRDAGLVRELLAKGAGAEGNDGAGKTPLLEALNPLDRLWPSGDEYRASLDTARALLAGKADPNGRGSGGQTPLLAAMALGPDLVELLVREGADVNAQSPGIGTPLSVAVSRRGKVVPLLLRHGARPNDLDGTERAATPLLLAAEGNDDEALRSLLQAGANPNLAALDGTTPLLAALARDPVHVRFVQMLLASGAAADAADAAGRTPLHVAAQKGPATIVGMLLRCGGYAEATAEDGTTPLAVALRAGRNDVAAVLRAAPKRPANPPPLDPDDERCVAVGGGRVVLGGLEGRVRALFDAILFCGPSGPSELEKAATPLGAEEADALRGLAERCRKAARPIEPMRVGEETSIRIVVEGLRQSVEAFTGSDIAAMDFLKKVRVYYEWEGMSDGPFDEGLGASRLVGSGAAWEPYALLFALHRFRCAYEYACREPAPPTPCTLDTRAKDAWQHDTRLRRREARRRYSDLLARALSHPNPLVRLAASDLDSQPAVCGGPHP